MRAVAARDVDHPHLVGGQVVDRPGQVEVAVHDRAEPVAPAGAEGGDGLVHQRGLAGHRLDHRRVVLDRGAVAHRVVHGAGRLGQPLVPGHEQRRQQLRRQRPVLAVAAAVARVGLLGEVHDDHAAVDGDHPVLRAGRNAQLLGLRLQDDGGLLGLGDVGVGELVEVHQRQERGGDDRRRAAQPDSERDVGAVLDGEVAPRQVDAAIPAVAVQADDERLDQADAAVVPEAGAVADQRLRVVEGGAVSVARHHRQARGLVDGGLRAEGVEQERDHLAAEDVGRIADQPGSGIGGSVDHHRAPKVSAAAGRVNSATREGAGRHHRRIVATVTGLWYYDA